MRMYTEWDMWLSFTTGFIVGAAFIFIIMVTSIH